MASIVIEAWLELNVVDRQVAVLRLSYPEWKAWYEATPAGLVWRAEPTWQVSAEQFATGVRRRLERGNPVALMADLSRQRQIVHSIPRPPA
ncbi:hypothetical protein HD597_011327 [Nonomuraea thailandensis]|uniref:Uncharacterized protein n=1 Tax=Nonomuraea thailandensis TaxID=1188745 RepID=A0A9X2GV05_9ACTN|nr:hypothetical protein [Nonomuraea thailandensis]MCP2364307.1 hypothetical protein [Nonomuraea thailandensis]